MEEEVVSLGHAHGSALLSHTQLKSDWCTSLAAPGRLYLPANTNTFKLTTTRQKYKIIIMKLCCVRDTLYLATWSEHNGLVLIIFQTGSKKQDRAD